MSEHDKELKATDLLPPDQPEQEEAPRKLAERRVAGWSTSDRLLSRRARRPVGNSRGFWSRIEDDDPFAKKRVKRAEHIHDHDIYATGRLVRVDNGRVTPAKPRSQPPAPRPKPRQEAKPPPKPAPQPKAPAPTPRAAAPAPSQEGQTAPPLDRRPPRIIPKKTGTTRAGRVRVGKHAHAGEHAQRQSAAQIRAEKEAAREAAEPEQPPELRNLDGVLSAFGNLMAAQQVFEENEALKARGEPPLGEPSYTPDPRPAPRPKPKRIASPAPVADRAPPKPAPQKTADRTPPPSKSKGLDDLFGGSGEGRVKIGPRTTKKS